MPAAQGSNRRTSRSTQKQRLLRMYAGLGASALVLLLVVLLLPGGDDGPRPTASGAGRQSEQAEQADDGPAPEQPAEPPAADEPRVTERYPREEQRPQSTPEAGGRGPAARTPPERPGPEPEPRGSLAIVIDDVGNSLEDLEPFLELGVPLTIAVLPRREFSREAALRAAAAGHEVIMHQPMEPVSDMDPGPGAIRVGMPAEEIRRTVRANLKTVPGIRGVNNHMGSRATADPLVMDAVLRTLKEEGLFFLDSRTSVETVGRLTAEQHNLPYLERAVFLDNESNRDYIRNAVREGMQIAERKGHAVMIGHVMVNELVEVLNEMYPFIQDEGFDLRYLSDLLLAPELDDDPRS